MTTSSKEVIQGDEKPLSQNEIAPILGVSQAMVSKYVRKGKIPAECIVEIFENGKMRRKILPSCAKRALEKTLSPIQRKSKKRQRKKTQTQPVIESETIEQAGVDENMSFAEAQRQREIYRAALLKLELEEKERRLLPSDQVKARWIQFFKRAKVRILAIKSKCAPLIMDYMTDPEERESVLQVIDSAAREALEELSTY